MINIIIQPTEHIMAAFQNEPGIGQPATAAEELCMTELDAVNGGSQLLFTLLTNLANMRREMMKSIISNIRG